MSHYVGLAAQPSVDPRPQPPLAQRIASGITLTGLSLFVLTFVVPWVFGTAPWGGWSSLALLLPIAALTRTIEIDLLQMLGEADTPPPLQPVNGVLY